MTDTDRELMTLIKERNIPGIVAVNKTDIFIAGTCEGVRADGFKAVKVSTYTKEGINDLKEMLSHVIPDRSERKLIGDLILPGDLCILVCPIDESAPKGIGFICRNTDGNRTKDFYVNSIRQVERITGYKFFPNLNDSIKNLVYDMDDINAW